MDDIIILGRMTFAPSGRDTWLAPARSLVATTLQEDGCVDYAIFPDPDDDNAVAWFEHWASDGHLQAHLASEHFRSFVAATSAAEVLDRNVTSFTVSGATSRPNRPTAS